MNGLSVIIPSKLSSNLESCVAAVRRHEPEAPIFCIDDGLAYRVGGCNYLDGIQPFIFARNVNLGIQAAGRDDIIVLNDDAILETPGGFSLLQRAAAEHPEFGIIAATTNCAGNTNQFRKGIGLREEPRQVCFICVLIPRRTIDLVGLLDERFVCYGCDDDDYSLRVRQAGLKLGIHDDCFVDHNVLPSSYRGAAGAGGDFRPNLKLFIEKYGVDNWGKSKDTSPFRELFP